MGKYWRIYKVFAAQFFKKIMQSKIDFFMGFFGFFFTQATGIVFIYLIFEQIPTLAGWNFNEILFIYGFAQIPRGIDHIFTDNIWHLSDKLVIRGDFDRYLLRPINIFFHMCADKIVTDGLGEIVVGFVLAMTAAINLQLQITFFQVIIFLIATVFGAIIYTSIKLLFASLSFWIKDSFAILQIAYTMSDFAKYPTNIYTSVVKFAVSYMIPFAFTAFYPGAYFLGKMSFSESILLEIIVAIVAWLLAYRVFTQGIKVYESAGS